MEEITRCPFCKKRLSGVKHFDGFMANLLAICIKFSGAIEINGMKHINIVTAKDLSKNGYTSFYARISDLRYWGLLERKKEWNKKGIYQITEKAVKFVNNELSVPIFVRVSQNKILNESPETITFIDAIGDNWATTSEYIEIWRMDNLKDNRQGRLAL